MVEVQPKALGRIRKRISEPTPSDVHAQSSAPAVIAEHRERNRQARMVALPAYEVGDHEPDPEPGTGDGDQDADVVVGAPCQRRIERVQDGGVAGDYGGDRNRRAHDDHPEARPRDAYAVHGPAERDGADRIPESHGDERGKHIRQCGAVRGDGTVVLLRVDPAMQRAAHEHLPRPDRNHDGERRERRPEMRQNEAATAVHRTPSVARRRLAQTPGGRGP